MLISKEKFIYYAEQYKAAYEERLKFHTALQPFFESCICTYQTTLLNDYEALLSEVAECKDHEDSIFWWWVDVYEDKTITVRNTVTGDDTIYNVETAEGLYNYLYDMYHHDS